MRVEKNTQCGCTESSVWTVLDEMGVEYERDESEVC